MATRLGGSTPARGEEPNAIGAIANGTTVCVVQLDLARLTLPDVEPLKRLEQLLKELRQAVGDQTLTIAIDLPYRSTGSVVRLAAKTQGIQQEQLKQLLQRYAEGLFIEQPITQGEWTVVGVQALAPYETKSNTSIPASVLPVEFERWKQALSDPTNSPLQVAVVPPSYLRRAFQELAPELPAALGGGSSQVLVEGMQWLHLSYDPDALKGRLLIQSDSAPAAAALAKHVPQMLRGLIDQWGPKEEASKTVLMALVGLLQPQQQAGQLVLPFENAEATQQMLSLLTFATQDGESRIVLKRSSDKLRQLVLANHNYESTYKSFPPDAKARGKDGRSGLSWRVHILPFVGEVELYRKFKLDEAWDSPHNIKLLSRMPAIFAPVKLLGEASAAQAFHTTYAAPVGDKTILGSEKPITIQTITDGTSNTVLIVELAPEHAIPWTSPEDYRYDPQNPAAKLYSHAGKALVAFGDGSVRSVRLDNAPQAWGAAFTMNGAEMVDLK